MGRRFANNADLELMGSRVTEPDNKKLPAEAGKKCDVLQTSSASVLLSQVLNKGLAFFFFFLRFPDVFSLELELK